MSLTLATGETIRGLGGAATSITYTIFGDEIAAGVDAFKVLAQGQLPSSIGTLYTVPASTAAIVKTIHLANPTAGTVTAELTVNGTAAANVILPPISILAGGYAVFADDGWKIYNDQGQLLSVGAQGIQGIQGIQGDPGADGMSTAATPNLTLDTTNAIGAAATAIRSDATIAAFDATVPSTQAFGDAAATGSVGKASRRDHKHAMPSSPLGLPLALTGAVAATRYVGGTASVAPTTGTFAVGDFVLTQAGSVYICTAAGSPGTWVAVSGSGTITTKDEGTTLSSVVTTLDFVGAGVTASGAGATTTVTIPGGGGGSGVGDKLYLFANFR
jgi:hypothetical protein